MKRAQAVTEMVRTELKKATLKRVILLIVCLAAGFFTLQVIGKPLLLPFPWGVELEAPSAAYFDEDASVIVDQTGSRLLFLDEDERLVRMQTLSSASQIDFISGVTRQDGSFYIWGNKMVKDSGYTKYDQILRCSADGSELETVYRADRTQRDAERCLILDVDTDGRYLWITEILNDPHNIWDCGLTVLKADMKHPEQAPETVFRRESIWVCSAGYLPESGTLYVSNNFGELYRFCGDELLDTAYAKPHYVKNVLPVDEETLVWCESDTRDLYCNDRVLLEQTNAYNNLSVDRGGFAYDDEVNNCLHRVSLSGEETGQIFSVRYAPVFGILTLLRFASVLFLAGLLLFFLIRRSIKARRQSDGSLSRKGAMLIALFLIAAVISVFYTAQVVKAHEESRDEEITVMSRYFSDTVDRGVLRDAVFRKDYLNSSEEFLRWEQAWGHLSEYYGDFRDRDDPSAKAAYINFYQRVGNDYLCVFDSWTVNPIGSKLVGVSASGETRSTDIQVFRRASESIIYKTTPIGEGDSEPEALLLLGMDYELTRSQVFAKCLDMTLTLTILFVTAFLLFTEGKKLLEGLRRKKRMQAQGQSDPELALVRPLFFLFNLTSSFDGVILVLVAKDMLEATAVPESMRLTLMAVPALVAGIGSIIGLPLCNFLAARVPVRKLTVASCVLCIAAFAGMSLSVFRNFFALFCVLKFAASVLNSVLYGVFRAIPLRAKDEETRFASVSESEMGRIASTILGPLLGGVVAQYFSNVAIYLLNAASFVPVIALLFAAMPKRSFYSMRRQSVSGGKNLIRFFFSVPTAAYLLLLVIPAMTIGGYKNYLFPIYLSAMDLPPIYITFFYVLALSVAMLLINPISNALRDMDHWKKTVLSLLMTGVAFLGFAVNRTFYWAILILVINAVLERVLKVSMVMLWPRQAKQRGLELIRTSNVMSAFEQGAYALKETVLSLFLLLGNNYACVAVGGFCMLCAGAYALLTSRSAMAKPEQ